MMAAMLALVWGDFLLMSSLYALLRRLQLGRRQRALEESAPARGPVLLVRPCAGDEPGLVENLTSVARSSHSVRVDVVMGVSSEDDAALPHVRRAAQRLRAGGMHVEVDVVPPRGPNRKASILSGLVESRLHGYAVVISADSNVDLEGVDLDRLVAPLQAGGGVGVVWAAPAEEPADRGAGNRASQAVLCGSLHAFGILSAMDRGAMVGKLFAVSREALVCTGGFGALTRYLGEDMEMARRVREAGLEVRASSQVVRSHPAPRALSEVVARHARWMAVIRAQRPWLLVTYPLMFASTPPLLLLAGIGAFWSPWVALVGLGLGLAGRLLVGLGARLFSGQSWNPLRGLVDLVLADLVILWALGRVLSTRRVQWRGRRLLIDRRGRLQEA
jgi:ceramide glucosyltransferase